MSGTELQQETSPVAPTAVPRSRLAVALRWVKWPVLALWIVAAVFATPLADRLSDLERADAAAYLPEGADSTRVIQLIENDPGRVETSTAVVVYHREASALTGEDRAAIASDQREAEALDLPGPVDVGPVQFAPDGRAALFTVNVQSRDGDADVAEQAVEILRGDVGETAEAAPGLRAQVAGEAGIDVDNDAGDIHAALLLTSMVIVTILLLLTYRSLFLWLIPLFAAVVAVQVARGAAYGLGRAGLSVTELSSAILIVLVFGAATDYALLLLNRYREELARHEDRHEAVAEALRRTTPVLMASAGTVAAGLLCLLAADLAGLRGLGPVAASGVVVALLAMLTMLPALLACTGRWVLWPRIPSPDRPRGATEHRIWHRLAGTVTRRPRPAALISTLVLAGAALGLTTLHTSADPLDKVPPGAESVAGQRAVGEHFPPGLSAPLLVVLPGDAAPGVADEARRIAGTTASGATVTDAEAPPGHEAFAVQLAVDPYGDAAAGMIRELRRQLTTLDDAILVGGTPAVQLDYQEAAVRDTRTVVPMVLIAVTLVLGLLLRSVVAPAMLLGSVVLSFAAALGLSSLVFTHLLGYGGVAGDLVIYVFVFLVALGVDYTVFLMDRVREERRRAATAVAVRRGLTATGGVITAAGLVLAGTFSALAQLPDVTVAQVGIAVAVGVLIDTLIVRTVQVPALVTWMGDRTWWPRAGRFPPG